MFTDLCDLLRTLTEINVRVLNYVYGLNYGLRIRTKLTEIYVLSYTVYTTRSTFYLTNRCSRLLIDVKVLITCVQILCSPQTLQYSIQMLNFIFQFVIVFFYLLEFYC